MKTLEKQQLGNGQTTPPQNNDRLNALCKDTSNKATVSEVVHLFLRCIQTKKALRKERHTRAPYL